MKCISVAVALTTWLESLCWASNSEWCILSWRAQNFVGVMSVSYAGDPLFQMVFPDTEIAKKYGSSHRKINVLVEILASDDSNYIASQMQNQLFTVATNGSIDRQHKPISNGC